jgi:hypothetical protein
VGNTSLPEESEPIDMNHYSEGGTVMVHAQSKSGVMAATHDELHSQSFTLPKGQRQS